MELPGSRLYGKYVRFVEFPYLIGKVVGSEMGSLFYDQKNKKSYDIVEYKIFVKKVDWHKHIFKCAVKSKDRATVYGPEVIENRTDGDGNVLGYVIKISIFDRLIELTAAEQLVYGVEDL